MQASSKSPSQRDAKTEATLRQQFSEVGSQLATLETRMASEFPAYAALSNPKPSELSEAQALLAPEEAMLVYAVDIKTSWLWAVRRDHAELYKLDIDDKTQTLGRVRARR